VRDRFRDLETTSPVRRGEALLEHRSDVVDLEVNPLEPLERPVSSRVGSSDARVKADRRVLGGTAPWPAGLGGQRHICPIGQVISVVRRPWRR
jgi:hypothetical protein